MLLEFDLWLKPLWARQWQCRWVFCLNLARRASKPWPMVYFDCYGSKAQGFLLWPTVSFIWLPTIYAHCFWYEFWHM